VALKPVLSLRALAEAASRVEQALEAGELEPARQALRSLVSRPTGGLTAPLVASAAIESLAENLPDSLLAPVLYYLIGGLPAAYAYRTANTLDAMIGYRDPHYEYLGKAAARLDDLLNLAPARLGALALALAAGGTAGQAVGTTRRERSRTASPNAGWPMSAAAGALGVRLEKPNHYRLGDGFADPTAADVRRAVQLVQRAAGIGVALLFGGIKLVHRGQFR
jgi:adenosylcobinamide-phosphate synthase